MSAFSRPPAASAPRPGLNQVMGNRPAPQVPGGGSSNFGATRPNPFGGQVRPGLGSSSAFGQRPANNTPQRPGATFGQRNTNQQKGGFPSAGGQQADNANAIKPGINYGDDKYITDLKTLSDFYEENRFTQILEQRYENFNLSPEMPRIVYPKDELYAQLKYYDDVKKYEHLNEKQLMQVQQKINYIIKQINYIDNYEFFLENNHDIMAYNPYYEIDNYKDIRWFQREDNIKTPFGFADYIDISIPKEKWWLTQVNAEEAQNHGAYVNTVSNANYSNDLLGHPMFRSLREYAAYKDLPQDPILVDYPNTSGKKEGSMNTGANKGFGFGQQAAGFPKKNNQQGPVTPSGFPQRGNQNNPQGPVNPPGFPQRNNNGPKPGGFGNR